MKLSCLPVSLYPDLSSGAVTLADWFRFAADLGLDGADISVAHLDSLISSHLATIRGQAQDAGVQIPMLVTYSDFTHPDAGVRQQQAESLRTQIGAAADLGARFLRVTAGQAHPDIDEADGLAWAATGLSACLDDAREAGVTLCYENHTIGYGWTERDFSLPATRFLEIVARTTNTDLKILFDTANTLVTGDDPLVVLDAVLDRVAVVHVSDIRRASDFEPVEIGTGAAAAGSDFCTVAACRGMAASRRLDKHRRGQRQRRSRFSPCSCVCAQSGEWFGAVDTT